MTDSAAATGPGAGSSPTGAGRSRRRRRWLRWSAVVAALLVLVAGGTGWMAYEKLNGNITEDSDTAAELARFEKERPSVLVAGAQNLLLIGSDSRAGENGAYGRNDGTQRSDTTILLHVAADRGSATAVSFPRDLMVDVPGCRGGDGSRTEPMFAMFNYAFEVGGTACTIRTVEKMTGVRIDHHMVVDFQGFKNMVDAVDGVEVCLDRPIRDADAHLSLPAGRQVLDGEQALGYVRVRKSLGNGSDTDRMDRQQRFLGALVTKVQSDGVLLNPTKLYPVLDAATSSLTTDPGLASLRGLYDLVRGMRGIPAERIRFLTVPRRSYVYDANRDELVQPAADQLFTQLRTDSPVAVYTHTPEDAPTGKEEGETPTFHGNIADRNVCG
ncbi:LCP family protein [Streptomyces sp. NPDC046939]|uniref:LCP family protein n=1 Tax=Streptomyces sp. NPDC046939 TaxID=3155376 RepID=UPI0033EF6D5B